MKNVLVGIDGGEGSKLAARKAAHLTEAVGGTLHLVTVVERSETTVVDAGGEQWFINSVEEAHRHVDHFVATLGLTIDHQLHCVTGDPADGLLRVAAEVEADLIVVGNLRMQGFSRIFGSVAGDVLHRAECDVLVARTN